MIAGEMTEWSRNRGGKEEVTAIPFREQLLQGGGGGGRDNDAKLWEKEFRVSEVICLGHVKIYRTGEGLGSLLSEDQIKGGRLGCDT